MLPLSRMKRTNDLIGMKTSTADTDILPSLSLTRRPGPPKNHQSGARAKTVNEKKHSLKRPCIPIPSFQAERANLERIFDGDSSSDGSPLPKKKTKKRIRQSVPIPSFSSADDDVLDDEDILNAKPVFACDSLKSERRKEATFLENEKSVPPHDSLAASCSNSVPISITSIKTTESEPLPRTKDKISTKEAQSSKPSLLLDIHAGSATSNKYSQTAESNLNHGDEQRLTEDKVMQLAVGIARSLDPSTFSFKQVQSELEAETGDGWKRVKLAKLRQFILQQLEPTEEVLHAAIDSVFLTIDIQSSTKKQFIAKVQDKFHIPFSQLCRTKITRRLTSLLNKETSPTAVAMANRDAIENKNTMSNDDSDQALFEEKGVTLTESVSPVDGTKTALIDVSIDNISPLPPSASNSNENERSKLSSDIPELPEKPIRGRCDKFAPDARQTNPTLSKEKKMSTRVRKARKTASVDLSVSANGEILLTTTESPLTEKMSRKRKPACQLCVNCPCSLSVDQPTISLSEKHSNPAVEKNLIKRLQKLEKIADYYEEQTDSVRRMLKKHRREIWKKREGSHPDKDCKSRPRFLPDAGELGEVMDSIKPRDKMGIEKCRKAQLTVFARAPVVAQSTLTQLLGITRTTKGRVLETSLDEIMEETEVDLKDEKLSASDGEANNEASVASVASGEEDYFSSEPVPFSRVECRNGRECMRSPAKDGGKEKSMWISMLTGRFSQCLADLIENSEDADDSSKLDNLVEMIDESSVPEENPSSVDHNDYAIKLSMLSQRGQTIAQSIIEETEGDPKRSSTFERHCPQWKENILFALHQRDSDGIAAALKQLQSEKSMLSQRKALMLQAIEERSELLNLYENSLKTSMSRFSDGSKEVSHPDHSIPSPRRTMVSGRLSLVSEVPTVRFTASQYSFSSPVSVSSRLE